uniref:Uncharacterized protein n=1 Tax=Cyprinodon variegatus TaxID=28743 RepID=A0A3Q2FRY3_CYPVA
SAISSGSLEQSFPAAALRSCRMRTWSSSKLFSPKALDARSLASWNSSFKERLVSITERLTKKKKAAALSSALSQNSLPLFSKPASRNSPVDSSSIPAMLLQSSPDWASPPRM